jgi:hypothetical protein
MKTRLLALVAVVLLAAGYGASRNGAQAAPSKHTGVLGARVAAPACRAGRYRTLGTSTFTYAAAARGSVVAYRAPGGSTLARFERLNVNGAQNVFSVLGVVPGRGCSPVWFKAELPMRPNGAVGWIRAGEIDLLRVDTRITIDLRKRSVTLYRSGRRVLSAAAAVGAPATPTPTGRYYVNQRLIPADASGPFGPGAIGISAFSPVLTGWVQGGPIAIHGTNAPWSIGRAVSNGCIRVRNDVLRRLFDATPAGTPVVIR